jgi:polyisoprenoid-binding protein YceI
MKLFSISLVVVCVAICGCNAETKKAATAKTPPPKTDAAPKAPADPAPKSTPANDVANGSAASQDVALTPENTKIEFVGTHAGDKPDPRKGSFAKFNGTAKVDGGRLASVTVDIETESLTTEIDKLTNHLKSADFFDVKQYPTARFESTKIESAGKGKVNITGNLTLHNETKSITFPATVSTTDKGLAIKSEFQIDRTEFGMNYAPDKVEKQVAMTVTVGG